MRVYNGKNSTMTLPLVGSNQRLTIPPHSPSGDFLPNKEFLNLIMTTFDYDEIALIINGQFELNMCSSVSGINGFVEYTLEDAIKRFQENKEQPTNPANLDNIIAQITEAHKPIVEPVAVEKEELPSKPEPELVAESKPEPEISVAADSEVITEDPAPRRYRRKKTED